MLTTEITDAGITCRDKAGVLIAIIEYRRGEWLVRFCNGWSNSGLSCHTFKNQQAAEYLVLAVYTENPNPTTPPNS